MKINSTMSRILTFGAFIALSLAAGAVGSAFTLDAIPTWYATLVRPSWTPPSWVFGPVWTTLYILMGIAAGIISRSSACLIRTRALWLFCVQLIANAMWSILFFGMHDVQLALILLLALDVMVAVLTLHYARRIDTAAAWLLAPYLAWILYATTLNAGILFLN